MNAEERMEGEWCVGGIAPGLPIYTSCAHRPHGTRAASDKRRGPLSRMRLSSYLDVGNAWWNCDAFRLACRSRRGTVVNIFFSARYLCSFDNFVEYMYVPSRVPLILLHHALILLRDN